MNTTTDRKYVVFSPWQSVMRFTFCILTSLLLRSVCKNKRKESCVKKKEECSFLFHLTQLERFLRLSSILSLMKT